LVTGVSDPVLKSWRILVLRTSLYTMPESFHVTVSLTTWHLPLALILILLEGKWLSSAHNTPGKWRRVFLVSCIISCLSAKFSPYTLVPIWAKMAMLLSSLDSQVYYSVWLPPTTGRAPPDIFPSLSYTPLDIYLAMDISYGFCSNFLIILMDFLYLFCSN
jgi:hypothetical protein